MRIARFAVTALILVSTYAAAQEISCDYSKTDFARFKTYAWASGHPEAGDQNIVSSIDAQLSAKRLTKVSLEEHPDLLVSYGVVFDHSSRRTGFRDGLRKLHWRGDSKYVLMGMLTVSLADADTGATVWRGMATGDLDEKPSAEKRARKVRDIVERIFRTYPPKE